MDEPAFPQTAESFYRAGDRLPVPSGMTIRDVAELFALAGILAAVAGQREWPKPDTAAVSAEAYADAWLEQRAKREGEG